MSDRPGPSAIEGGFDVPLFALLDDTFIEQLAAGDERVGTMLRHIAADLGTYIRRIT